MNPIHLVVGGIIVIAAVIIGLDWFNVAGLDLGYLNEAAKEVVEEATE